MNKTLSELISDGHQYIKLWPMKRELFAIFPECRIIKATQLSIKVLPVVALISFFLQVQFFGFDFAPQALALSLLVLSLPVQGYIWLGNRANQVLPLSLHSWYKDLETKLAVEGVEIPPPSTKPRYFEMASLLNKAFKKLDSSFTRDLF